MCKIWKNSSTGSDHWLLLAFSYALVPFLLFPFSYSFIFHAAESFFHLENSVVSKLQSDCRGVLVPLYGGVYLKVWPLNLPHCRWLWKTILMSSTSARWSLSTCSSWRTAKWVQAHCAHMLTLKTAHRFWLSLGLIKEWIDEM